MKQFFNNLVAAVWAGREPLTPLLAECIAAQPTSNPNLSNLENVLAAAGRLEDWQAVGSPLCEDFVVWWKSATTT